MHKRTFALIALAIAVSTASAMIACSNDDSTAVNGSSSGNPLNPGSDSGLPTGDSGGTDSSTPTGDGGCPNKPAGCFCGTPTTQKQFLNRCTNAAALPVNLTPKAATTADIP